MSKFQYESFFKQRLDSIKEEGRYRVFQPLKRKRNSFPVVETDWGSVVVWCSNDYMCMSQASKVIEACREASTRGIGSGGTRNISGTSREIMELEVQLASLHKTEAALVGTSGYVMNQAALGVLGRTLPGCLILSDELNHSSMISGIKSSGCEKVIFNHNSVNDVAKILKEQDLERPKLIAFESIYSMQGDTAPIEDFYILARNYGALMYVDEVHAVGLYGDSGGGICQEKGIKPDIVQGNFGKGFGTFGGYIASGKLICDLIRSEAPEFIFTTSIPVPIVAATMASISACSTMTYEREDIQRKSRLVRAGLQKQNIETSPNLRQITPVQIGDPAKCEELCRILLEEEKIYLQPINYPSVKRGEERVRVTVTRLHTDAMVHSFVEKFSRTWNKVIGSKK